MASAAYLGENILQFFLNMCVAELKDTPSSEDKFKSALVTLRSNSSTGAPQKSLNFGAPYNRAAYMYKFQPCIAWTTFNYIHRAMIECPEVSSSITRLLNSSGLKLCCIGGGAGADLIGFLLGISGGTIKAPIKSLTVIPETAEWRCTINRYIETLKTGILNPVHRFMLGKKLVYTVLGCDFVKRPNSRVAQKMKEANVFLVDKVFPATATGVQELEMTLGHIMSAMKPGALVFFIDHSVGFNVMLRTAHCTSQQILFGPLREQYKLPQLPEVFKTTYNCYPQMSSRMYFMVWKKVSNDVSAAPEDSNLFTPFPALNLTNESTCNSSVVSLGVLASTSICESSIPLPQKKLSSDSSSLSKGVCSKLGDTNISCSEEFKSENLSANCSILNASTITSTPLCKSVGNATSAVCNSISDKKDILPFAKSLRSEQNDPSLPVFGGREITESQSYVVGVSNREPVTSIDSFADLLTYRILADARLEMMRKVLLQKDRSVEEFLYGQSAPRVSSDVSNLYAGREMTERLLPYQMSCDNRNATYQNNDSFAQETRLGGSESFCATAPRITSSGILNSFPETKKENRKHQVGLFQFDKCTQTGENEDKLSNTIHKSLSELTQHVDRLTSVVEELVLSQSKEHSCCCSTSCTPLSDMCLGTENKFPYLVLPLENLSDNPMLLSLLLCQSENTKS